VLGSTSRWNEIGLCASILEDCEPGAYLLEIRAAIGAMLTRAPGTEDVAGPSAQDLGWVAPFLDHDLSLQFEERLVAGDPVATNTWIEALRMAPSAEWAGSLRRLLGNNSGPGGATARHPDAARGSDRVLSPQDGEDPRGCRRIGETNRGKSIDESLSQMARS